MVRFLEHFEVFTCERLNSVSQWCILLFSSLAIVIKCALNYAFKLLTAMYSEV